MNLYSTTDVLSKAIEGTWERNKALTKNIANVDTPNYKRKDVVFEDYLREAIRKGDGSLKAVRPRTFTDYQALSYRKDGNNVDIDVEMSYLANNQLRYNALISQVNYNFQRIKDVLRG